LFENGVVRGIFGQKKEEVISEWREKHDEYALNISAVAIYKYDIS
jgi:hypothetical protein